MLVVLMGPDELLLVAMAAPCDNQNVELRFIAFVRHLEIFWQHAVNTQHLYGFRSTQLELSPANSVT